MALATGVRLGHLTIIELIGAGGMGEVYRARDTTLARDVAVKILPAAFAQDPERLARFEREARTLAAVNHANIAHVYGFETHAAPDAGAPPLRALVMELVEGEDLSQRIARGRLPFDEAQGIAKQMAVALDAAHTLGIVHRDLKPANIKIGLDGTIKLLDFGLAKALDADSGVSAQSVDDTPTISSPAMTRRGVILGTAAYMAPEQARGRAVDKRADIWAFGVVLYEMLAGRRPFGGDDPTAVIAQVLEREPDWSALPRETPAHIQRLLRRCLTKDPKRRLRDSGDALFDVDETPQPTAQGTTSWVTRAAAAGAIGLVLGGLAVWLSRPRETVPSPGAGTLAREVTMILGPQQELAGGGRLQLAISRSGQLVIYPTSQGLMARRLDDLTPRIIAGTEPVETPAGARRNTGYAVEPVLSPNGEHVAYYQNGELKRVPVAGGTPRVICACRDAISVTWNVDQWILFGIINAENRALGAGVWRVPAQGGDPQQLIETEPGQRILQPQALPDGDHVLFTIAPGEHWDQADVVVQSISTKERKLLVKGGIDGRYLASGHLVYGKDGVLHSAPFDAANLRLDSATPVLEGAAQQTTSGSWGGFSFSASDTGSVVYVPEAAAALRRALVWKDRAGNEEALGTEPRAYQYPRVSPDGQHVALDMRDQLNDVWRWDLTRENLTPVTHNRRAGGPAIWNKSSNLIYFGPDIDGTINLHAQGLNGSAPRRLLKSPNSQVAEDITPDGQWLLYREADPVSGFDIYKLGISIEGEPVGDPVDVVKTRSNEANSDISPDGHWIAYQSDEGGRFEVYVRPFPQGEGSWKQVSSNGGTRPLWGREGNELFFLDLNYRMMRVPVNRSPTLSFGSTQPLFDASDFGLYGQQRNYDLSPDGKRFLMVRDLPPPQDVPTIVLIQNWLGK